jgi:hypothetical protein
MYPAGVIITITVIAFSFVGDALLDALEVRVEAKVMRGGAVSPAPAGGEPWGMRSQMLR